MKLKVIGIGELLWDVLPSGARMGGAPANFACHAKALGADSGVVSRVGDDADGHKLIARLKELGLDIAGVSLDSTYPTGSVEVRLGTDGQPSFIIHEDVAWDHLASDAQSRRQVADADAVCFGSLGQRGTASRAAIRKLVTATRPDALRVFDVNLRQSFFSAELIDSSLELANVLKISDSELPVVADLLSITGSEPNRIRALVERYGLRMVVYTRGSEGSVLCDGPRWLEHPGVPTVVVDTIGAGDSFTAAVTLGMLRRWPMETISDAANEVASHVCSCSGANPSMPARILKYFQDVAAPVPGRSELSSSGRTSAWLRGWQSPSGAEDAGAINLPNGGLSNT